MNWLTLPRNRVGEIKKHSAVEYVILGHSKVKIGLHFYSHTLDDIVVLFKGEIGGWAVPAKEHPINGSTFMLEALSTKCVHNLHESVDKVSQVWYYVPSSFFASKEFAIENHEMNVKPTSL